MKKYSLNPASFSKIRKKIIIGLLPTYLVLGVAVGFIFWGRNSLSDNSTIYLLMLLFIFMFGFSLFNTLRRQKKTWNSFRLTISPESISLEREYHSPISIVKEDIVAIEENEKVYHVRTASKFNSIIIYKEIENKEEVEVLLREFKEITPTSTGKNWQLLQLVMVVLVITLFYLCLSSDHPLVSILSGVALIGGLSYSLFSTLKAKQLETRVRRMTWVGFIPLLVISLKVFYAIKDLLQ